MSNERVFKMAFSKVYPLLVQKVERKGRTKEEVDTIIYWLTGYDEQGLQTQIANNVDYETFFNEAPQINPHAAKITGVICGVRVEEIKDPLMQKIRWLDKLVDELAGAKLWRRFSETKVDDGVNSDKRLPFRMFFLNGSYFCLLDLVIHI